MFRLLPALLLVLACGGRASTAPKAEPKGEKKVEKNDEKHDGKKDDGRIVEKPKLVAANNEVHAPPLVIFFVLDTVRSDHLSLCGYERPTSPFLQELVSQGAAHACFAYSPGTWTIPSHASYFTGVNPSEHKLLDPGFPLPQEHETLAESFAGAGYQTVFVGANPTIGKPSGLWQGFHVARASEGLKSAWRHDALVDQVADALTHVDREKPLFLFVNLFDAHDPYPAVPPDVKWLPRRLALDILPDHKHTSNEIDAWWKGELAKGDAKDLMGQMTDTYDYGVSLSDRGVRGIIEGMREKGWMNRPYRIVVTSDHGEHLGEHDLLRHDGPPWEGVARVPLLFLDTSLPTQPTLPRPVSALDAYFLVRDGALPSPASAVVSSSVQHRADGWTGQMADAVAMWQPDGTKYMWIDGKVRTFSLMTDPHEKRPAQPTGPAPATFDASVAALQAMKAAAAGQTADPEVLKMLEAVGYMN
jgi:hypothetical protein